MRNEALPVVKQEKAQPWRRLHLPALLLLGTLGCAESVTPPRQSHDSTSTDEPAPGLVAEGAWQVTTIPSLGGTQMRGLGINDSGVVAGWGTNGANKTVAFRWRSGTLTTIAMPILYQSARARAINSAGRIVGDVTLLSGQRKGFTSVPGVVASLLPVWANSPDGDHIPYDINDSDEVVGDSPLYIPVVWTLVNSVWQLDPDGYTRHYEAISAGGLIAGTQVTGADGAPHEAFRAPLVGWPREDLGTLDEPPEGETFAADINGSGHVVGIATREAAAPTYFLWSPADGLVDLGIEALPPSGLTDAKIGALNSSGRVVGVNAVNLQPFTRWNGVTETLPLPADAVYGFAEEVNSCGVITGWVLKNDWSTAAVIWRRYNGRTPICDHMRL